DPLELREEEQVLTRVRERIGDMNQRVSPKVDLQHLERMNRRTESESLPELRREPENRMLARQPQTAHDIRALFEVGHREALIEQRLHALIVPAPILRIHEAVERSVLAHEALHLAEADPRIREMMKNAHRHHDVERTAERRSPRCNVLRDV